MFDTYLCTMDNERAIGKPVVVCRCLLLLALTFWLLAAGGLLMVAGCWLLAVSYWFGCCLFDHRVTHGAGSDPRHRFCIGTSAQQ